ncbi:Putative Flp pilus-assembly TadE/G-like [Sphingobium faniae]|nr:Putative Flp pilus-assembly TadE/G-like [Sphingobium faniae]
MSIRSRGLIAATGGAVAPTVALSLFGLIAAGGIAFDYARLAAMDTELQSAADQAALAAASQLDGKPGACARAAKAARDLVANDTRFANDGEGLAVTIPDEPDCDAAGDVRFYETKDKSTAAVDDATAKFVEIQVGTRRANYAFTPIVAAFHGDSSAKAYAGVDGALCAVVPFFICNPDEPLGNTNPLYPVSIAPGTGIQMLEGGQQKGPGNFGFLVFAGRGANNLAEALSKDAVLDDCASVSPSVDTEPGQMTSVFDALNRRFDVIANGNTCPQGPCSPSTNVVKDLVLPNNSCSKKWQENDATAANLLTNSPGRYRPSSNAPLAVTVTPTAMGLPRDICHAVSNGGSCTKGQIGDGVWDRGAYFRSNHPGLDWSNTSGLGSSVTRYQTYLWEAENASNMPLSKAMTAGTFNSGPICSAPGIAPNSDTDRRRLTSAVVNCRAAGKINGRKTISVAAFSDIFLVEPSFSRTKCNSGSGCNTAITGNQDIYVEFIGASGTGQGGGTPQITRRETPRLIE